MHAIAEMLVIVEKQIRAVSPEDTLSFCQLCYRSKDIQLDSRFSFAVDDVSFATSFWRNDHAYS